MAFTFEHLNELSVSIKDGKFIGQLSEYHLLKFPLLFEVS